MFFVLRRPPDSPAACLEQTCPSAAGHKPGGLSGGNSQGTLTLSPVREPHSFTSSFLKASVRTYQGKELNFGVGHTCVLSHSIMSTSLRSMACSPPGSSVHGILQARILEWVAMPSSRGSLQPRDQTQFSCVSCIAGRIFTTEPLGKPLC